MLKNLRKMYIYVLTFVLLFSFLSPVNPQQTFAADEVMDEFDLLRQKWSDMLTGGVADADDPDIAAQIGNVVSEVQNTSFTGYWDTLQTGANRDSCACLWTDLRGTTVSANIVNNFRRIRAMALAYQTPGASNVNSPGYNPLYHNATLKTDIIEALDWMYTNRYNERTSAYNNWYHWEMSGPINLEDAVVLMYDELLPTQITNYMNAVNRFAPDPNRTNGNTANGANRVEKSWIVALRGIIIKDAAKVAQGRDGLSDATTLSTRTNGASNVFKYVNGGAGMHPDGSFIMHTNHPYNGNYGTTFLSLIVQMMYLLSGSTWEIMDENASNVYKWVYDAYEPIIYNGALMDMARGRTISYSGADDHAYGHVALRTILLLSTFAPSSDANAYKSMVKYWINADTHLNFMQMSPIFYIVMARTLLMNDSSVVSRGELIKNKIYTQADRAVHLSSGYGFGIAMSSSRISRYESLNGDNLHGWHMGDGATYVYTADSSQYNDNYWPTVNPYRLPGTTVDVGTLANAAGQSTTTSHDWVGGVSDGTYGAVGMQWNAYNSSLTGKKSWFLFDDEVVALGAGISSTSGRRIETIVDNRKLNATGNNAFIVDGTAQSTSLTEGTQTYSGVNWLNLEGNVPGANIGYYFPGGTSLKGVRETRTGSWRSIQSSSSSALTSNNYETFWFDHGIDPADTTYAYAILPNFLATETASFASDPDFTIVENSPEAQAVQENSLNLLAVNFWNTMTKTVGSITSDNKASVLLNETTDAVDIYVSDPTQSNPESVNFEINNSSSGILYADPNITVTQLSPTIKFSVNVNGSKGKTFHARFNLGAATTPVAPTLNNAEPVASGQIALAWSHAEGAAGYKVKYGTAPGSYTNVVDMGLATNGTVSGLTNGLTYYFVVFAYSSAGESGNSNEESADPIIMFVLQPDADAFVRDGTPGTNYGTDPTLVTKKNTSGVNRETFLRFDLSSLTGTVQSAKIRLIPVSVGSSSTTNRAHFITNNAWGETTLTWSNRPAAGTLLSSWSSMSVGKPIEIDVTTQVNDALFTDQKISIGVYSPIDVGHAGDIIYGSKEQTMAANRPQLIITQAEPIVPAAPTLVSAEPVASGQISLAWSQAEGATGYKVKYGTAPGSYTNVVDMGMATNGTVTGLTNGLTYYFAVSAYSTAGESGNSNEESAYMIIMIQPEADAFVRDGTPSTNYGSDPGLVTKKSTSGVNRESFLRFDLSSLTGTVQSAKIKLIPVSVGSSSTTNRAYFITDNTWGETTLTWSNRPAAGILLSSWSSMSVGTPIEIDVTTQVNDALFTDQKISIGVYSPTNVGSAGDIIYGSKEQTTAANRPQLIITQAEPIVPAAPILVSAEPVASGQISLAWSQAEGATGYKVKYGTTPGSYTNVVDMGMATNGTVTGLTNGMTYYFAVSAYSTAGESGNSNEEIADPINMITLQPEADTFVRDGTPSTNYGSDPGLVTKKSTSGVNRESFLRFDLSSLTGTVQSAKIRLIPVSVGSSSTTNRAHYIANNTWGETTLTWSNRPAAGTLLSSWSSMSVGTPIEIDVTTLVNNALLNDQKISIGVYSPTNVGSAGDIIYGSKEQATAANRPLMIITQ
ncbi:DUF7594 domain-containing protein [Paenibacillus agaridevorans]|uniref:CBM96 family carbohydrate-binding protein n=1 Tax=Paenibacillus agaridevorans TaxID=171404 RepID=UPI001BE3F5A0|nr:polysaccharide lyase family 8 super-sandwich domain-containing protein [Paenibacillus agaridevorans]